MIDLPAPLSTLRASGSDKFDGWTFRYPNGRPVTRLRLAGDTYFAADDAEGVRPLARVVVPAQAAARPLPPLETFPVTLNGAIRFKTNIEGAVVADRRISGPYRGIETDAGVSTPGIKIQRVTMLDIGRDGIRLRDAPGAEINDFEIHHTAATCVGSDLPEGIALYKGTGVTIRDGIVSGFRMSTEINPATGRAKYTNGDGIATEGGTGGLIQRVRSIGNTDGGYDLKGDWRLEELVAFDNNRAYRIWGNTTASVLTADTFSGAGIWLGKGATLVVDHFIARSSRPAIVFRWEAGARLIVKSADLSGMVAGSTLLKPDGQAAEIVLPTGLKFP